QGNKNVSSPIFKETGMFPLLSLRKQECFLSYLQGNKNVSSPISKETRMFPFLSLRKQEYFLSYL
ncbi:MAG: hypothetical protein J1F67_03220, partial [Muribaculaceae bacterium]|nr:hypothetical protein [Muribaculaceae bacterium]